MFSTVFAKLTHLPVNVIKDDVASDFLNDNIPIVTSEVGSGKTLLIPTACAVEVSRRGENDIVYVLEPTRLLVGNAARTLRKILGKNDQDQVGYIMSSRSGEQVAVMTPDTRIVFCTVGWALKAGIVRDEINIILDEVHDTSIDLSIAKAVLHARRERGETVRIALLSATVDVDEQKDFWGEKAVHFTTEGSGYPLEFEHVVPESDHDIALIDETLRLILKTQLAGRDQVGVAVFVAGKGDIEDYVGNFRYRLDQLRAADEKMTQVLPELDDVEIATIHGKSSEEERAYAEADPRKKIKILVGTNVMESGVSIPWFNAGVSSGNCNVASTVRGAKRLVNEELPVWRIRQQAGRVNRFSPGMFSLVSHVPMEKRPDQALPDIVRLDLDDVVFHMASENIDLSDLKFSERESVDTKKLNLSVNKLSALGLIELAYHPEDDPREDAFYRLTQDGLLVEKIPTGYRARAALAELWNISKGNTVKVADFLPLIAMIEIGDIRYDRRNDLFIGGSRASDLINQTMAVAQFMKKQKTSKFEDLRDFAQMNNINMHTIKEYDDLLMAIEKIVGVNSDFTRIFRALEDATSLDDYNKTSKQLLFRAYIDAIYSDFGAGLATSPIVDSHSRAEVYFIGDTLFGIAGDVRRIDPKKGTFGKFPFHVITNVTAFTKADIRGYLAIYGRGELIKKMSYTETSHRAIEKFLETPSISAKSSYTIFRKVDSFSDSPSDVYEGESEMALAFKKAGLTA